jgi:uncharacterized protein YwqG
MSLPDWQGVFRLCPEAVELSRQANSEAPWEAYRLAVAKVIGESAIHSTVGGYPRWIQGDETPDGGTLLAQIDSEHEAGIMWGDVGCVYLFLSQGPEATVSLALQCC